MLRAWHGEVQRTTILAVISLSWRLDHDRSWPIAHPLQGGRAAAGRPRTLQILLQQLLVQVGVVVRVRQQLPAGRRAASRAAGSWKRIDCAIGCFGCTVR